MTTTFTSRRSFLKLAVTVASTGLLRPTIASALSRLPNTVPATPDLPPDYTLHIAAAPIEISPKHILSTIAYNGQFPGPLLRFKEGQQATVDVFNDTDTPEQLHWHGQFVSPDVDGAAEEGTPFIPAHGMRRITVYSAAFRLPFLSHP